MIYGLNFGAPDVAQAPIKFARRIKYLGRTMTLGGITDDDRERAAMVATADNGKRVLYVRMRMSKGVRWFGIYTAAR